MIKENYFLFEYNEDIENNELNFNIINYTTQKNEENIPLNNLNKYKEILKMTKLIKDNPFNYDFIKKKVINDNNLLS